MGLRETLNKNPAIMTGVTAAVLVGALALIVVQFMGGGPPVLTGPDHRYFTVDDGATFVQKDAKQYAPVMIDGKEAYEAVVYTCDDGATKFVGYLVKYTPAGKAELERAATIDVDRIDSLTLVKKPKTGNDPKLWVPKIGGKGDAVMTVLCPNGQTATGVP